MGTAGCGRTDRPVPAAPAGLPGPRVMGLRDASPPPHAPTNDRMTRPTPNFRIPTSARVDEIASEVPLHFGRGARAPLPTETCASRGVPPGGDGIGTNAD